MSILEQPVARRVIRARARTELAPIDYYREIVAAATEETQNWVASLTHLSQPRISQIVTSTVVPPEGFSGATPKEIALRFAAGEISDDEVIDQLGRWNYNEASEIDEYDDLWEPGPGTWVDVEDALSDGLISAEIYDAALQRHSARLKGDG